MKGSNSRRARAQGKERRDSPRLRVNPLVYLNIPPANGGFVFDLGEGGMGIRVANPLGVAAQVRFSFPLGENQLVQGTARVCWVSETGRSAGVRFMRFEGESRSRIEQWLRSEVAQAQQDRASQTPVEAAAAAAGTPGAEAPAGFQPRAAQARPEGLEADRAQSETNPVLADEEAKTASAFTIFSSPAPRPGAMPAQPPAAESNPHPSTPDTPLFFFPKKNDPADASDSLGLAETPPYADRPGQRSANDRDREETEALQSAILSGTPAEKDDKRKNPRGGKVWIGAMVCAALVAGAALSYSSPGVRQQLRGFISQLQSSYVPQPSVQATPSPVLKRRIRRGRGRSRGSRPFRMATAFPRPGAVAAPSPGDTTGFSIQGSPGTLSNEGAILPLRHDTPFSSRVTVSMTSSASNLQFIGTLGDLRNDGALVEEGVPVSIPLNPDNAAAVQRPIVVEAVVGKDGGVKDVQLISRPDSKLAQAVVEAVRQWRYRPLYKEGQPVQFTTQITFNFSAPPRRP